MIKHKYYKCKDKLFKTSDYGYLNDSNIKKDVFRYDCDSGWIWNPRFLGEYKDSRIIFLETNLISMEITEEQMNIEINKLEMMRELRK